MNISPQVREITELLSTFAGGTLEDSAMMERFLQHAQDRNKPDAVGTLAFQAKFLTRVQSTIRQQAPDSELYAKLEQEFSAAVHEFHGLVTEFVADAEADFREMAEKHFLAVNESALRNLMRLAHDFTWMKNWELEMTQNAAGAADSLKDGD